MYTKIGYSGQQRTRNTCQSHGSVQNEDTHTAWDAFPQHLVDSHGQDRPDPHHTETEEIIQTLVYRCPSCDPGHTTCAVQNTGCESSLPKKSFFTQQQITHGYSQL